MNEHKASLSAWGIAPLHFSRRFETIKGNAKEEILEDSESNIESSLLVESTKPTTETTHHCHCERKAQLVSVGCLYES